MNDRPLLYDVFSGAGGAGYGYQQAGFRVIGIDNRPQPRYPCDGFIQMDAFDFFDAVERGEYPLPDMWHASPPCQLHSAGTAMRGTRANHLDLIPPARERLKASGVPYIIENVVGAPLIHPIMLCGTLFPPLRVLRHRLFETSWLVFQPGHPSHPKAVRVEGLSLAPRGAPLGKRMVAWRKTFGPEEWVSVAGHSYLADHGRAAMGIPWMTRDELSQAIPPAYTRFIGEQAMRLISDERMAAIA